MDDSDWIQKELATLDLGDTRRDNRAELLLRRLGDQPMLSIPAACNGWAETKAAYRFLSNESVSVANILKPHISATLKRLEDAPVVLCIEDTSEIDYTTKSDIEGLGPLNYEARQGFYAHPMIAVTPDRLCHGVLDYEHIIREQGSLGTKKDASRSIEEKESVRWLDGFKRVCELKEYQPDTDWVYVADREADICDIFAEKTDRGERSASFVIRSQHDRVLKDGSKLRAKLQASPVLGEITFDIPKSQRNKGRTVTQHLRAQKVTLRQNPNDSESGVELYAVMAKEIDPPAGEEPVTWVLLTDKPVTSPEEAAAILQLYLCRWQIEIFFKILKSGCKIEQLQLEHIDRLEAALAFYMIIAWRVLYLTMLGRSHPEMSCDVVFEKEEWQAAYVVAMKEPPPQEPPSLDFMIKLIAGFGGFVGRKSDGFPGTQTIWTGLQRCRDFALAVSVHKEMTAGP